MPDSPHLWSLEKSAEIADLWEQLLEAAEAGDERARDFLATFAPWAQAELSKHVRS